MRKFEKILSIIPARGGSKGLPGKNIKNFNGKPLIAWTIEESLKSKYITKTIVSSDDEAIINIAKNYGAEVPFVRPKELATDISSTIDVVLHAINWFKEKNVFFDYIIILQPTSPLRKVKDIDSAIENCIQLKAKAIISVCKTDHHPFWCNTLPPDMNMKEFLNKSYYNLGRQNLPEYYRLNGAIYISDINYLKINNGFFGNETYAFEMNKKNSVDIDDEIDFKLAELLSKNTDFRN